MKNPIRVILIHPYVLYRESLTHILSQQPHIEVLVSVPSVSEMLGQMESLTPDVIIIDSASQGQESLSEFRHLHRTLAHVKILMLGLPKVAVDIRAYIEAGAVGYVPYGVTLHELFDSIRKVAAGEVVCTQEMAHFFFTQISMAACRRERSPCWDGAHLTKREREILLLLAAGLSNKEISASICVAVTTVKNHVHSILRKLQLESRRETARYIQQ